MCEKVEAAAATAEPLDIHTSGNKGHNRAETRTVAVFEAAPAAARTEWQDLVSAIVMVTRTTCKRGSKTGLWSTAAATSLYLSSQPVSASLAADAIRDHWGIENRNHYPRDVAFCEDASRIRGNPGIFARGFLLGRARGKLGFVLSFLPLVALLGARFDPCLRGDGAAAHSNCRIWDKTVSIRRPIK